MLQPHYQTVFELGFRSFPWAGVAHPLIAVVIGLLLILFLKRKQVYLIAGILGVSFGSLLFFISLINLLPRFVELRSAYRSGQSSVVEGVVEDFHQAPAIGPARESFSVGSVVFSYNALDYTPCFHNSPLHHGPIRNGVNVRIYYNAEEHCIQRVDIVSGLRE